MQIHLTISALPTTDGKFLPKFQFFEIEGVFFTTIPYDFGKESIRDTKEEALKVSKAHGIKEAIERYGKEVKIFLKEE